MIAGESMTLQMLALEGRALSDVVAAYPRYVILKDKLNRPDAALDTVYEALRSAFADAEVDELGDPFRAIGLDGPLGAGCGEGDRGAAGSVILKLPTTAHPDLVANEYAGYQLCRALGLQCADARVIDRAEAQLPDHLPFEQILAVQRFDHLAGGARVHMEEFNQVLGYTPRQKYGRSAAAHGALHDWATMLRVLNRLSRQPVQDTREFLARMVAFILMGNTDAHLKNWALVYPDGRLPQLAPLYDPVCVAAFFEGLPESHYGMNRAIDRTLRALTWDDMAALLGRQPDTGPRGTHGPASARRPMEMFQDSPRRATIAAAGPHSPDRRTVQFGPQTFPAPPGRRHTPDRTGPSLTSHSAPVRWNRTPLPSPHPASLPSISPVAPS